MKTTMKYFTRFLILLGLVAGTSCSQKDKWDAPEGQCQQPSYTANATIADILALSPSGDITQIDDDLIFEGYVISSDEAGNYYTGIVLQDAPQNPSAGIYIAADKRNLYVDYPVGKKVLVRAKGLFIGKDRGVYKLGLTYDSGRGTGIGRIPASEVAKRIIPTCDDPVQITPQTLTIPQILAHGDQYLNTLIQLNDVEFAKSDLCSTYALEGLSGVNKYIEDCNNNQLIMRNSGYARFASLKVPAGKGTLVAVLGKYRNDFQVYIRDTRDVNFDGPRCDGSQPDCDGSGLQANTTIADLKAALGSNNLMQITQDWVIEASVSASDKSGNLYKAVYIQDASGGIRLNLNMRDLYLRGYHRGAKLKIKLQDLYVGRKNGEIQLGDLYNGSIGRITDEIDQDHIFFTGETEDVQPVDLALTPGNVGRLVRATGQFADNEVMERFAYSDSQSSNPHPRSSNRRLLTACDGSSYVTVRTSGYADFADAHVRKGNGTVVGVLGVYDANHDGNITDDEYQIYLRDIYDVDMPGPRCDHPYLLETFGNTTPREDLELTGWYNYVEAGTRAWQGGFYSGSNNHYAQFSAYRSNEAQNIAWLISPPVAVQNGMKLTFQTAKAYWTHDALKVYISTDFNGYDVRNATWTELPARLATDTDPNHAWIDSGDIDLSAYAGQTVFIAFRYKGSGTYGQTGTYRVDNVVIK